MLDRTKNPRDRCNRPGGMATNFQGVDDVRDLIARALGRACRPILALLLARLFPATGRHRKSPPLTSDVRPAPAAAGPIVRLPAWRSSYSSEQTRPLNGEETALVRPYWAAHERAVRRRRRRVLWLATVGLDLDTRDIHAMAGGAR